jgi:hypothetical protein
VRVTRGDMFFSLLDPLIAPGDFVAPGASVQATVQYRRPPSGGQQLGELHILSNDVNADTTLVLSSNADFNAPPNARITVCQPSQLAADPDCLAGASSGASFRLSMLDPKQLTFSGKNSIDDGQVREYQFTLRPTPPATLNASALSDNGQRITGGKSTLTIPPNFAGNLSVLLVVFDDRGQPSPSPDIVTVTISP